MFCGLGSIDPKPRRGGNATDWFHHLFGAGRSLVYAWSSGPMRVIHEMRGTEILGSSRYFFSTR
jgi:hypothetical protein